MDLCGNRRKRTTDKLRTTYVDEVITYLYVVVWRRTSMRRKSYNPIAFDSSTLSVLTPIGIQRGDSCAMENQNEIRAENLYVIRNVSATATFLHVQVRESSN
jgi:hypothetical protein